MRLQLHYQITIFQSISIHASHAGCDMLLSYCRKAKNISIHASHAGCDFALFYLTMIFYQFQSTHPMRDATLISSSTYIDSLKFQSTHPMRDATVYFFIRRTINAYFNPRIPCGMRLAKGDSSTNATKFQSTHPMRDATLMPLGARQRVQYFNPRIPCGMRPATCRC